MQNENSNASTDATKNATEKNDDIAALETKIRDAVAQDTNVEETVRDLTLKAMKAGSLDFESIRRIVTAVMQGAQEGAHQKMQHATDQTQTAKSQLSEAIAGLDSALAKFAEASKLAVEEAASRAQKFSDEELTRTRSDLESLESLFLDTLQKTASVAKGLISDTLQDLLNHAKRNGTAVGEQLKETLVIFSQQMSSVGHAQLEAGLQLTQVTADLIHKIATGMLSGIKDQSKPNEKSKNN